MVSQSLYCSEYVLPPHNVDLESHWDYARHWQIPPTHKGIQGALELWNHFNSCQLPTAAHFGICIVFLHLHCLQTWCMWGWWYDDMTKGNCWAEREWPSSCEEQWSAESISDSCSSSASGFLQILSKINIFENTNFFLSPNLKQSSVIPGLKLLNFKDSVFFKVLVIVHRIVFQCTCSTCWESSKWQCDWITSGHVTLPTVIRTSTITQHLQQLSHLLLSTKAIKRKEGKWEISFLD